MNLHYENFSALKDHLCEMKDTSKDTSNDNECNMTDSTIEVVNFDKVKDTYIQNLNLSKVPSSSDALLITDNNMYLIEFKNTKISNKVIFKVHYKIYDSLLILTDIISNNVSFCRDNVVFILVYNEDKNLYDGKSAKASITSYFMNKANVNNIRFGLERFKNLYFKDVFTYTEKEFENNFLKKLQS